MSHGESDDSESEVVPVVSESQKRRATTLNFAGVVSNLALKERLTSAANISPLRRISVMHTITAMRQANSASRRNTLTTEDSTAAKAEATVFENRSSSFRGTQLRNSITPMSPIIDFDGLCGAAQDLADIIAKCPKLKHRQAEFAKRMKRADLVAPGQDRSRKATGKSSEETSPKTPHSPTSPFGIKDKSKSRPTSAETSKSGTWHLDGASVASRKKQSHEAGLAAESLRMSAVFRGCSQPFLERVFDGGSVIDMRPGHVMDLGHGRTHPRHAPAVVVLHGSCFVEVRRCFVEELKPGSVFGFATVLADLCASQMRVDLGAMSQASVRTAPESNLPDAHDRVVCKCILVPASAIRDAMEECPREEDHGVLPDLLRMVRRRVEFTDPILSLFQCSELLKPIVLNCITRHLWVAGAVVNTEGQRYPDGLILVQTGCVVVSVNGNEGRRIMDGQTIGEDVLLSVSNKWTVNLTCHTHCDILVLGRKLFCSSLDELAEGTTAAAREAARMIPLLKGSWKDDRIILSLPFFRGYDPEFLSIIAKVMEIRVIFPGRLVWDSTEESVSAGLYFVLHGSGLEVTAGDRTTRGVVGGDARRTRRNLAAGAWVGVRHFLGLKEDRYIVVKARTILIVAVLYRSVFLSQVDIYPRPLVAPEVTRLLIEDLDQERVYDPNRRVGFSSEPPETIEAKVSSLHLFRGCNGRLMERLSASVARQYCMAGQCICKAGLETITMFVLCRGGLRLCMKGVELRCIEQGQAVNVLALSNDTFEPPYDLCCVTTNELLTLTCKEFSYALDAFPSEKRRFTLLITSPLKSLAEPVAAVPAKALMRGVANGDAPAAASADTPLTLCSLTLFRGCSSNFLRAIKDHLVPSMYFVDQVIVREGSVDMSLYIICQGMIVSDGTATKHLQISLGKGAVFGEQRLLGLSHKAGSTMTAIEIALLQILHRNVFETVVSLFPKDAPILDQVAIDIVANSEISTVSQAHLLKDLSPQCISDLHPFFKPRVVHRGEVVLPEDGHNTVSVLCAGAVSAERTCRHSPPSDQGRIESNVVLNLATVLGLCQCATCAMVAEDTCLVMEMKKSSFVTRLQKFPEDIKQIVGDLTGTLWPNHPESIPLFSSLGCNFAQKLIDASTWCMYSHDHRVIQQGTHGRQMYLVCHGAAVKVRDHTRGPVLQPGECFGELSYVGLAELHTTSVFTRGVTHLRIFQSSHFEEHLEKTEHAAEGENVEQFKQRVREAAVREARFFRERALQEHALRRTQYAYESHVNSVRSAHQRTHDGNAHLKVSKRAERTMSPKRAERSERRVKKSIFGVKDDPSSVTFRVNSSQVVDDEASDSDADVDTAGTRKLLDFAKSHEERLLKGQVLRHARNGLNFNCPRRDRGLKEEDIARLEDILPPLPRTPGRGGDSAGPDLSLKSRFQHVAGTYGTSQSARGRSKRAPS